MDTQPESYGFKACLLYTSRPGAQQLLQRPLNLPLRARIHTTGGLVEDEDARINDCLLYTSRCV